MALSPSSTPEEIKKALDSVDPSDKKALQALTKDLAPKQVYEVMMPYSFEKNPDASKKLAGINAIFQFVLEGEGGGTWALGLSEGKLKVTPGGDPNPNCTITMKVDDWKAMNAGTLNPQMAFMSGKLKFKGDMSLAMKLGQLMG